jgi:hypothetical protein
MNLLKDDPYKPTRVVNEGNTLIVPQRLTVWGWIVSRFIHVPTPARAVQAGPGKKYGQTL